MPAPAPPVPAWYNDYDINFSELTEATGVPRDTLVRWHTLLLTAGHTVGQKIRREWLFSCRELVLFQTAAALTRLHFPVGPDILRQVCQHVSAGKERTDPFMLVTPEHEAAVTVHCPLIFTATVQMMTNIREAENA